MTRPLATVGLCVAIGVAAPTPVLLTARHQAGTSPDSVGYIAAARHIARGDGVLGYDGLPFVYQPPLYPATLALVEYATGVDPLASAIAVNAALFGMTVALAAFILLRLQIGRPLVVLGTSAVAVSAPLAIVSLMAWSEPLFIALSVLCLAASLSYLRTGSAAALITMAVAVALAAMTRYAGVAFLVTSALCVAAGPRSRADKARDFAALVVIAALPLALWTARDYRLTETLFGPRWPSSDSLALNVWRTIQTIQSWLTPGVAGKAFVAVVLVIAAAATRGRVRFRSFDSAGGVRDALFVALFMLLYGSFLIASSTMVAIDPIGDRLLSPLLVPTMVLAMLLVSWAMESRSDQPKVSGRWAPAVMAALWLVLIGAPTLAVGRRFQAGGLLGYAGGVWEQSETLQHVIPSALAAQCAIYSNNPPAVYLWTNRASRILPVKIAFESALTVTALNPEAWPEEDRACVVWFATAGWPNLFTLDDLRAVADLKPLGRFSDGAIFLAAKGRPAGDEIQ